MKITKSGKWDDTVPRIWRSRLARGTAPSRVKEVQADEAVPGRADPGKRLVQGMRPSRDSGVQADGEDAGREDPGMERSGSIAWMVGSHGSGWSRPEGRDRTATWLARSTRAEGARRPPRSNDAEARQGTSSGAMAAERWLEVPDPVEQRDGEARSGSIRWRGSLARRQRASGGGAVLLHRRKGERAR